jgi:hypothetical protein
VCEEWRGYRTAVDALLATTAHHSVEGFVVDTNYEHTGIGHQLFSTRNNNLAYLKTFELFGTVPLTTLELSLNVVTANKMWHAGYACLRKGSLRSALSQSSVLEHFAFSTSLEPLAHEGRVVNSRIFLEYVLPVELWATLESRKLCNLHLEYHSLYRALTTMESLTTLFIDTICLEDPFEHRLTGHGLCSTSRKS